MAHRRNKKVLPPIANELIANSDTFHPSIDVSKLSSESQTIVELMMGKMGEMRRDILSKLDEKNGLISDLEGQVLSLKRDVNQLTVRLEDVESYQRGDSVIISGNSVPEVKTDENCPVMVQEILQNRVKYNVPLENIVTSYRIGRKPTNQIADKRNIYVKLANSELKNSIIMSSKKVKPIDLYVNENLTPTRAKIMSLIQKMRKENPSKLDGIGTREGRVYAWIKPPGPSFRNTKVFFDSITDIPEGRC